MIIDTHTHLYDEAFDGDRRQVVDAAVEAGVEVLLLPAIDSSSHRALLTMADDYPGRCLPMMGLHPTSVNDNPHWQTELELVENHLRRATRRFCAIGEVGLDMHWSAEWADRQIEVFRHQVALALELDLPLVIHTRDCWPLMISILNDYRGCGLRGVMHAFSGTVEDYAAVKTCGDFVFGVGGVATYKNSLISRILPQIALEDIVLESDAPYLAPTPMRGQRNQSAWVATICCHVAQIMNLPRELVERQTTANARRMFAIE
ncbi:TatD family hydrolase [Bacteroidia bacterium]|nr:TatD family hydrolase [Bacteroidia bacterium]